MKVKIIYLIVGIMLITSGCKKIQEGDCYSYSFKSNYFINFYKSDDTFIVIGVASETKKHGRHIKVIEDLKGNFADKSSIFVWGACDVYQTKKVYRSSRMDYITQYQKNDTLIMIMSKAYPRYDGDIEKYDDYATLPCYTSVLKISDGYVTGHIDGYGVETALWEELQKKWQEKLQESKK